jgi:hypothetical protein
VLALLWPRYDDEPTGADPVGGWVKRGEYGGPSQVEVDTRPKERRALSPNKPLTVPDLSALVAPALNFTVDESEMARNLEALLSGIRFAALQNQLLDQLLISLEAELKAQEEFDLAALLVLLE